MSELYWKCLPVLQLIVCCKQCSASLELWCKSHLPNYKAYWSSKKVALIELLNVNLNNYNVFQNFVWLYLIQLTGWSLNFVVNLVSYWSKYFDSLQAVVGTNIKLLDLLCFSVHWHMWIQKRLNKQTVSFVKFQFQAHTCHPPCTCRFMANLNITANNKKW